MLAARGMLAILNYQYLVERGAEIPLILELERRGSVSIETGKSRDRRRTSWAS
jgi:hypothetical protein